MKNFSNFHTHNLAAGPDAIINLPSPDTPMQPGCSYSIGVHPWHASEPVDWAALEQVAANEQVVAIGECGLDGRCEAAMADQETAFLRCAALSERLGKPLIIHAVKTLPRIMQLRQQLRPRQTWIIHGFRGKPETAQQLVRAGFHISLGEKYNPAVLNVIPAEMLHRETD